MHARDMPSHSVVLGKPGVDKWAIKLQGTFTVLTCPCKAPSPLHFIAYQNSHHLGTKCSNTGAYGDIAYSTTTQLWLLNIAVFFWGPGLSVFGVCGMVFPLVYTTLLYPYGL